jgi:hypothetical protein
LPLIALFVIVLLPWTKRLQYPSVLWDDVTRVIDLQTLSLPERMMRPFNEHLAPMFELVTAATWECTGHRLTNVPLAFTLASYVPYVLSLGMLWVLSRREWGSPTVAGVAVALFAATSIYAECVLWFSASSFNWALLFTLAALFMAGLTADRGAAWCAVASAAACLIAPMGSAIGLLAGPAATIRAWPARRPSWPFRAETLALAPALGTLANLLIVSLFDYRALLVQSIHTDSDVANGLGCALRAPLYLVLTGYGRVEEAERVVPHFVSIAVLLLGLVLVAVTAARSPADRRRWLAIGTFLVACGYTMIYCFRFKLAPDVLLRTQRYHLFPCLGLVLLLTSCAAQRLRRLDDRPVAGPALVLGLAVALIVMNRPLMNKRMQQFRLYADQRPVLAMIDHVADGARSRGLSREPVVRAFAPLEPRWSAPGWNILRMLPEIPDNRPQELDADQVRAVVLEGLSARDRTLLFANMNATVLLQPGASWPRPAESVPGRLVRSHRAHPLDRPGFYQVDKWPSYLEFTFPAGCRSPRALSLPGLVPGKTVEVSWAEANDWSSNRRVVVRLEQPTAERSDWVLALDRLPNLGNGGISGVRLSVRESGPVAIGTPALLR